MKIAYLEPRQSYGDFRDRPLPSILPEVKFDFTTE